MKLAIFKKIWPLNIQKRVKPHSSTETAFQHLPGKARAGRAEGRGTGAHEPVRPEEEDAAGRPRRPMWQVRAPRDQRAHLSGARCSREHSE